jgi:hypothetical protein
VKAAQLSGKTLAVVKLRFLIFLFAVVCLSCHRDGLQNGRVANLSPDLITQPRAEKIKSKVASGYERLYYKLEVEYPARPVIRTISAQLAARGWQPTRNSWFNRDEPSEYVRGWVQSTVVAKPGGKERFLARWWAQWQNNRGEVLDYSFMYLSSTDRFTNHSRLEVQATRMSAAVGQRLSASIGASAPTRPVILLPVGTPPNVETATDNSPNPRVFQGRPDGG